MKKTVSILLIFSILNAVAVNCSTMVKITSEPPDAELTYKGRMVGKTPLEMEMSDSLFEETKITLKKEGYQTRDTFIERRVSTGMLIFNVLFGIFTLMISWLYVAPPKEYQNFVLYKVPEVKPETAVTGRAFTDTVILKNGQRYENCRAAVTADSVIVTPREGSPIILPKSSVDQLIRGQ